jgi:DNA-directed RNA polymerase specialized sigma24 family protein
MARYVIVRKSVMSVTPEQIKFLVAWQLSPTPEVAADILGANVASVVRRAHCWRSQGVQLKRMYVQQQPRQETRADKPPTAPQRETRKVEPLTAPQQGFMQQHYQYALRAAYKVTRLLDVKQSLVDDLVEDAAVEALIAVSRRSTDPDFQGHKPRCFLYTAVYRGVRNRLAKHFGTGPRKKMTNTPVHGPVGWSPDRRFPSPVSAAIEQEEATLLDPTIRRAKSIIGEFAEIRRVNGEFNEWAMLRELARRLGVVHKGRGNASVDELRDRIATHVRGLLFETPAPEPAAQPVPEIIRQRLTQPLPTASAQQQKAEQFIGAWQSALSASEVARALGRSVRSVVAYANYLVGIGVRLKPLPTNLRPVIKHILRLVPSLN